MSAPLSPRLLPFATSIDVASDGSRHVALLLAEPPHQHDLDELAAFVGKTGTLSWKVGAAAG